MHVLVYMGNLGKSKTWKKFNSNLNDTFTDNNHFLLLFSVADFNEDDYICENDLKRVIQRLCGEQRLSDDNVNALIQKVISL